MIQGESINESHSGRFPTWAKNWQYASHKPMVPLDLVEKQNSI